MEDAAECLKVSKARHIHSSPVRNFWSTSPVTTVCLTLCHSLRFLFEFDHKISQNRAGDQDQELQGPHMQTSLELCSVCALHCHTQALPVLCPALFQKEGVQGKIQKP